MACDTDFNSDYDDSCSDSDMSTVEPQVGGGASAHNDLGCCGDPMVLLVNEPLDDVGPDSGKLWDPSQGSLRGLDGASEGFLQEMAAMIIMTAKYPARVARFDLLKCVLFSI